MSDEKTELEKRNMSRLSNQESNKLTKECIQTALIHLLATEDLEKITISKLVKKAGVSRTAFYNNYASKEDVLKAISSQLQTNMLRLTGEIFQKDHRRRAYTELFQTVKDHTLDFKMLTMSTNAIDSFCDITSPLFHNPYPDVPPNIRYIVVAWAGMIRNILLNWFVVGMKEDIPSMVSLCMNLSSDMERKINAIDPKFIGQACSILADY